MSRVFAIAAIGANVYVRSRDHCPPHVHITHRGEGWEARLAFSFLDGSIRLLDVMPLARAPRLAVLNMAASVVVAALPVCRAAWWDIQGKTCLDGQWMKIAEDDACLPASRTEVGALQIDRSHYDVQRATVVVFFKNQTESRSWRLA
ncbi:MAG: hypothetical protein RKP20_06305 [Candidatus Competibacter sp.]|nr:hypothetical protein [Candidatus Competibacter sp.]